jgi:hypothetical protein
MHGILGRIAGGDVGNLGDASTLTDQSGVDDPVRGRPV